MTTPLLQFCDLPNELQSDIFLLAARSFEGSAINLALVSKKLQTWIESYLYRTIVLDYPHRRTELFLRTLDARPKEFFATHVQRLYLDDMNLEDTEIENLLHTCSGIETLNCWFGFGYDRFKHPVTLFSSNLSSLRRLSIEFFALNMIWGTTVFESVTHLEVVNPPNTPFEWAPLSATTFPKLRYLAFGDLTYSEHIDLICSAAEVILKDCRSIELLILITPKEISLDNPRIITWRAYSHPKDHPTYWGDIKRGGVDFWDLVMYRTER